MLSDEKTLSNIPSLRMKFNKELSIDIVVEGSTDGVGHFLMDAHRMNKDSASLVRIMTLYSFPSCKGGVDDLARCWCKSTVTSFILLEKHSTVPGR